MGKTINMKTIQYKLGKKAARPGAVKFKLVDFINKADFPTLPKIFGHENLLPQKAWGMLGNDSYGDCVWAGAAHEHRMWNLECGKDVLFTDKSVLSDYSAVTGFDPKKPNTDQGTDMKEAAAYRLKTGIVDAKGIRHKVGAYISITPGDLHEHYIAMYLFGAVGIGIKFPGSAMRQFNQNKTWSVVRGAHIDGGHYVPLVAKRSYMSCVTWGQTQSMTVGFFEKYNDESLVYLTQESLLDGKSPEKFDYAKLNEYLSKLT